MTTTLSQTVFSPWLTPVRLVSTSNIAGTYYNGPSNNGVGATLTIAASSLTVDSVVAAVGDRILLHTQTATYQQGIYVVKSIGSTVVLERSDDQQNIEQMKAGEYVAVGAGSVSAGNFYTLVEPLPQVIGVDAIVFNADPSAGGVSFSGGPSTANAIPVFSDTSGNIKPANAAPVTLGQNLAVTGTGVFSGALSSTAGNITSGSSGDAGTFISFPATAANGTLIISALNAGGAFDTTIRNSVMGQSSVVSIPDPGAATADFILSAKATAQTIAGGLTVSTGNFAVSAGTITASGAITSTAGNITSGSSGDAGTFIAFPATAANGTMILAAGNAGGAFNTTITSGTIGQSTVYTVPDIEAATGGVVVSTAAVRMKSVAAAAAAGGAAAQSFTDTFCTAGSNVIGNWNTQANAASVLKIVPGNGSFVVTSSADAGVGTFNYIIMK